MTRRATIVMYHYVRRVEGTRFPLLPALDVSAFEGQLDYVQRHYSPVSANDLVAAGHGEALPARPILLTFDDGYADHYREVFPLLRERKIPAVFFPAAWSLLDRHVLDVNKIQLVLAAGDAAAAIVSAIDSTVEREAGRGDVRTVADYHADGWKPVRYDAARVSYVKYMLQRALPVDLRRALVDALFERFVSTDERAFADDLYFTATHAREMAAAGMTIGCHADRHLTLTSLSREQQTAEIAGALRVLDAVGAPRASFVYSYAKGAYDAHCIGLLQGHGCVMAVTNQAAIAELSAAQMLALPRLDANHLPTDGRAAPNEWTTNA